MVGVPRSKGCLACLQRRVKCDETQPSCQTCQARGLTCPGYTRDRKFYYRFSTGRQQKPRQKAGLETPSSNRTDKVVHQKGDRGTLVTNTYMPMDGAVIPNLVVRSIDEQCKGGFFDSVNEVFPNKASINVKRVEIPLFDFTNREYYSAQSFTWCIRSIGASQLGRANANDRQILAGREMYGRGLQQLVQAIRNPITANTDVTLAATMLLSVYEFLHNPTEESWLLHSRGLSHLFRLRGPQSHARGVGRTLLLACRGTLVFEAFNRGEACFLGDEEWRAILPIIIEDEERRGKVSRISQLIDYAFNETAQCPGFLVTTKQLVASASTTNAQREDLMGALRTSRDTLKGLESEMILGIQADQRGEGCPTFFGWVPKSNRDVQARYALEGICSAIALLQQLLAVLVADRARREASTQWSIPVSTTTGWELIKDADVIKKMTNKKSRLPLSLGPEPQGSSKVWPEKLCMSLGMPRRG